MKLLLDECVDRRFARELQGHSVETVSSMKWTGIKNGELLQKAAMAGFDTFITVDRNLTFQQNLSRSPLSVVVLCATSNRLVDLVSLAPALLSLLPGLKAGEVRRLLKEES